jgi:hypothetical protein
MLEDWKLYRIRGGFHDIIILDVRKIPPASDFSVMKLPGLPVLNPPESSQHLCRAHAAATDLQTSEARFL